MQILRRILISAIDHSCHSFRFSKKSKMFMINMPSSFRKVGCIPPTRGCVKIGTPSFNISQSPNFHKHGLCHSIFFLYLYGKNL